MAIAPQGSAPARSGRAVPYADTIDENIEHVRRKIRLADLGRGLLAAGCLLLGYALVVAVFDLSLGGSDAWGPLGIRLAAFAVFVAALLVLLTRVASRFLAGVNPYYAARRLEETIPDSKNSVINWLDLKDQPLPPVIHQAVGTRAARDVAKADPELVGSKGELAKLGTCAAVLFVGLVVLCALVPRQFGSLMGRAFLPIRSATLARATTITVVKPAPDAVVALGQRVDFVAKIEGRIAPVNSPGAPALLYRHTTSDAAVRVPLELDNLGQWVVRLSPDQVRAGLYWKIVAGDVETPEAQLRVRSAPFVTRFEATYQYRPYRKMADETITMPNELMPHPRLFGHRGTDVVLRARANTPVKAGSIELDIQGVKKVLPAELNPAEPDVLTFRLGLDRSGTFRIYFDSAENEKNLDRSPYTIDVVDDGVPMVELYKPGKDLAAPPTGTLLLEGAAADDFGVTGFTLKMTLSEKAGDRPVPLADQPYRPKTPIQFKNGTYPIVLKYLDVVELDHLKTPTNRPVDLRPGNEVHYWLEATDNNDFGRPNVGKSRSFKVTIQDNLKPKWEQKQERVEAQAQKEQHDKQQTDQHNKQEQNGGGGPGKGNGGDGKDDKKDDGNGANNNGGTGAKDGQPDSKNPDQKNPGGNSGNGNGGDGAKDNKDNPKNPPKSNPGQGAQGGGDAAADRQNKEDQAKADSLRPPLSETGSKINEALNKDNPKPQNGNDSPSQPGTKQNDPKSNEKDPKDPKSNQKDPAGSGGTSENGGKDPKGNNDGAGGTPGAQKKSNTPDPSADPTAKGDGKDKGVDGKGQPTTKKDNSAEKGKGNVSDNATTVKSDTKPQSPNPGKAKGDDAKSPDGDPKAASKEQGGKDQTPPQAKGKEGSGKNELDPKAGKSEPGKTDGKTDVSQSKGDGVEKKGPPTKDEIDALKDALKKGEPEADQAAKDLADRGKDMKDPKLKKNLEDVLKEFGREEDLKNLQGSNAAELAPMPEETKDGKAIGQAPKGGVDEKQGTEPSPLTGSRGAGVGGNLTPLTPEEMFARRMGSLQLENLDELKKRVTPKVLEDAKVSEAEWQRFLDNARQYQELMKRIKSRDDARFLRGGAGQMKAQGPRSLENNGAVRDPLTGGQSIAPPEFQEAERAFTRKK